MAEQTPTGGAPNAASPRMPYNSPDPHGTLTANPYKPVGGGGEGQAAGGANTYGGFSYCESAPSALDVINRSTGKGIKDTGNPPYNGGNYVVNK